VTLCAATSCAPFSIMQRLIHPFVLAVTAVLAVAYVYVAWRLTALTGQRIALAVPFLLVWIVPALYWGTDHDGESLLEVIVQQASYLSMAWVSFVLALTFGRDIALLATMLTPALSGAHAIVADTGPEIVIGGSLFALIVGAFVALRGPSVRAVDIHFKGLHPDLEGFCIAQISDLHVGRTIRKRYVTRVVEITKALHADLIALTGDMVDGSVDQLTHDVAPLRDLAQGGRGFYVLGNHDCYSGLGAWTAHFRSLGYTVLLNEHTTVQRRRARIVVAGVMDPAARPGPLPDLAAANAPSADLRLLLAHNPKIAPEAARARFDLMLSGHTHGGQFFPWTLAVRYVHAPHVAGLSREGKMWVYVSAGTGSWGPPVRFGTSPEVTLIRLFRGE
jgi:predicted MPP superfamily phosphohydrolase